MSSTLTSQKRLEPLATNLWGTEHTLVLPGGVHFRGRMSVFRLANGDLLLHSVVPIDDALAEELWELGPVRHIVAPNTTHHVHLGGAVERYPDANVYGPPGLAKKRQDVSFIQIGDSAGDTWRGELQPLSIKGVPKLDEVVFFHAATKTLIVADYFFNIMETSGWLTPWVLRLNGTYKRFAQSRLWRWVAEDGELARDSALKLLQWPFERVVVAHGEVLTVNAHAHAEQALSWLVGQAPKALPHPS